MVYFRLILDIKSLKDPIIRAICGRSELTIEPIPINQIPIRINKNVDKNVTRRFLLIKYKEKDMIIKNRELTMLAAKNGGILKILNGV